MVLIAWLENRKTIYEVVMGVLFGVMMMTNTWDVAVYGMVIMILGVQITVNNPHDFKKLLKTAGNHVCCIFFSSFALVALVLSQFQMGLE